MNKDKEYIVDKAIDATLTDEEKQKLKQKKSPPDSKGFKRQDLFEDRRDPYSKEKYKGPERRKNDDDRRGGKD